MSKDENPLWRKYMNNVDMMDNKWLKQSRIEKYHFHQRVIPFIQKMNS